jgi:hypothetical protein
MSMTEQEWLACADPTPMLQFLRTNGTDRNLRLFAVSCCRSIWPLLPNEEARRVVAVAERFAEGLATDEELGTAEGEFTWAEWTPGLSQDAYLASLATEAVSQLARESDAVFAARARGLIPHRPEQAYQAAAGTSNQVGHITPLSSRQQEWDAQARRIRCIFGNPFHPARLDPAWLTPTVTSLATAAYEERAMPSGELDATRLAILSDALEEAGCANADILGHLRGPGPHVRGCWVIDLLLGKK